MSDEVKIPIVTTADLRASEAAAASLGKVNKEVDKSADVAKDSAKEFSRQGEAMEKGAGVGRAAVAALRGDFSQLAGAVKGIGTALNGSLIGVLVGLAGIAATYIAPMIFKFREVKDEIEDSGKAVDDAKKKVKELGEQQLGTLRENLDATAATTKALLADFDSLVAQANRIDDVERALAIARINENPNLTPAQKTRKIAYENLRFDQRRENRTRDGLELAVNQARTDVVGPQAAEEAAAAVLAQKTDSVNARAALRKEAEDELKRIQQEFEARLRQIAKETPIETERQNRGAAALREAQAAQAPFAARLRILNSADGQAQDARLLAEREEAQKQFEVANKAALAASAELARAEQSLARELETRARLEPMQREMRRRQLDRDLATAGAPALAGIGAEVAPEILATSTRGAGAGFVQRAPDLQELNAAVASAAKAAMEGGTTRDEAKTLVETLNALAEGLRYRNLSDATIKAELDKINQRLKGLLN